MAKGDHLVFSQGIYQHHAIDLGDGRMAQYGGADLRSNSVEVVPIPADVQITLFTKPAIYEPDEIVERALSRTGENEYCLVFNNCEHFANWCRTGESSSRQVDRVYERAASAVTKVMAKQKVAGPVRSGARFLSKRFAKTVTPWMIVADIAQLGAEVSASNRGMQPEEAERIGQCVGLGTSVGIGTIVAGPLGALGGAGVWAIGEVAAKVSNRALGNQQSQPAEH